MRLRRNIYKEMKMLTVRLNLKGLKGQAHQQAAAQSQLIPMISGMLMTLMKTLVTLLRRLLISPLMHPFLTMMQRPMCFKTAWRVKTLKVALKTMDYGISLPSGLWNTGYPMPHWWLRLLF